MLPDRDRQIYQRFQDRLYSLDTALSSGDPDVRDLGDRIQTLQADFQSNVLAASLEGLDGTAAARARSLQTEMHKQLRLLGTDVLFLRSAKTETTAQQRQQQLRERVRSLLRYGEELLAMG